MEEEIKQGFYREPFIDYIKRPAANRSFLHDMITWSPGHAKFKQDNPDDTESLRLGHAFHPSVLELEKFKKEFVILPTNCMAGTKDTPNKGMRANKAAFDAQCAANDQLIINHNDYDNIREMAGVVHADQNAINLLSDGEAEVSGYFRDPDYPHILIKIRIDWLKKKERIITDLKSCADARELPFRAAAFKFGDDLQAFMYLFGATQITGESYSEFNFICCESKGYHGLTIYTADDEMLNTGWKKYQKAMALYAKCLERDEWPGYDSTPKPLGSPSYAKERIDTMTIWD